MVIILSSISSLGLAQEVPMFVGTYTNRGSQGVYLYKFDTKTGVGTVSSTTVADDPSFLAKSKDGKVIYAVNESGAEDASLSAYSFDGEMLSLLNTLPTQGAHPCHVAVSHKDPIAIVSNYTGGSLTVYSLEENGALGKITQHIQFERSGPDTSRQNQSHIHSAFFSSDGKSVYVQDLGGDNVTVYSVEKIKNQFVLQERESISTPPGGGPRHIVLDKKEKNLYVLLEMTAEIAHYQRQADTWEFVDSRSINPDGYEGANGAAEIKMSADERFIYASNRGDANTITLFNVDESGYIERSHIYDCKGEGPRNFSFTPNEKYLVVGNERTNNIVVFERDKKTGELTETANEMQVATPVCILF